MNTGSESGSHVSVIHTTSNHQFWDPSLHQWIAAGKLKKGEHLKTADGATAVADGGTTPKQHTGRMWDLTVPGDNDHDFYAAGSAPVLVHNCELSDRASEINNSEPDEYVRKNVTTVAVVKAHAGNDDDGNPIHVNVVAGAGDGLTPSQASAVGNGEIMADNIPETHAEQNALLFINKMGWRPVAGGTSRNVCRAICGNLIRGTGGRMMGEVGLGDGKKTWRQRSFEW